MLKPSRNKKGLKFVGMLVLESSFIAAALNLKKKDSKNEHPYKR